MTRRRFLRHITLDTGHTRDSYRHEVDDVVIAVQAPAERAEEKTMMNYRVHGGGIEERWFCLLSEARDYVQVLGGPNRHYLHRHLDRYRKFDGGEAYTIGSKTVFIEHLWIVEYCTGNNPRQMRAEFEEEEEAREFMLLLGEQGRISSERTFWTENYNLDPRANSRSFADAHVIRALVIEQEAKAIRRGDYLACQAWFNTPHYDFTVSDIVGA